MQNSRGTQRCSYTLSRFVFASFPGVARVPHYTTTLWKIGVFCLHLCEALCFGPRSTGSQLGHLRSSTQRKCSTAPILDLLVQPGHATDRAKPGVRSRGNIQEDLPPRLGSGRPNVSTAILLGFGTGCEISLAPSKLQNDGEIH